MIVVEISKTLLKYDQPGAKAEHDSSTRDYDRARRAYRGSSGEYTKAAEKEIARLKSGGE